MSSSRTDVATVDVAMPQMGVSVAEGTVVEWHKHVGDWVEADETICEISTDKIDTEVPSPASGRVSEILVAAGETVEVGVTLARIATGDAPGQAHVAEQIDAPGAVPASSGTGETAPASSSASTSGAASSGPRTAAPNGRSAPRYSPVVQRIAQEHGIDLDTLVGTGRGGRVRKQDVLAAVEAQEATPSSAAADPPASNVAPLHIESPYRDEGDGANGAAREAAAAEGADRKAATESSDAGGDVAQPLSRMRRSIGEHMLRSLHTAAHCTTIVEADMAGVERARRARGLSYLPFVARAVIDALRDYPMLNATLEGETLTRHRDVNLGMAVSLGEHGLMVPVVHRAQDLSVEGLAARISELAMRARSGELTPDDVRGGTFTITNPGAFGAIAATPIINQPQIAILDLEAVVKRPVVVDDGAGGDAIAIRPMANLCLSWDHRALDGALAAQFLGAVRAHVEGWAREP